MDEVTSERSQDASRVELAKQYSPSHTQLALVDRLEQYLDNPRQYMSSRKDIENLRQRLLSEVDEAVRNLLENSRTRPTRAPQLFPWVHTSLFFELLGKVYGTTDKEQFLDIVLEHESRSPLHISYLMNIMLAAAISRWVLEKQDESLPKDPTDRSKILFEEDMMKGMPLSQPYSRSAY